MKKILINKEELINLVESGLTISEISKEMTISVASIRRKMKDYNLKSKSKSKSIEFKYVETECAECHKKFKSLKTNNRKFCSNNCSLNNNKKILQERRIEINEKISNKLKKIYNGICLNCHLEFVKKRKHQVYCCRKCQSKHLSNKPETKERMSKFFSKLSKKRHEDGDTSIGWKIRTNLPLSYPEKITLDYFKYNNIEFERELKIGKYFIDFAFINKKIALEIDGRTHDDIEVIEKDKRKDKFLKLNDWNVYRIKWINDNKHFDRLNAFIVQCGLE